MVLQCPVVSSWSIPCIPKSDDTSPLSAILILEVIFAGSLVPVNAWNSRFHNTHWSLLLHVKLTSFVICCLHSSVLYHIIGDMRGFFSVFRWRNRVLRHLGNSPTVYLVCNICRDSAALCLDFYIFDVFGRFYQPKLLVGTSRELDSSF